MTLDDYITEPVPLWPENERVIVLFTEMSTQWRVGMGGPIGLDYTPLFHRMDRMGLSAKEYDDLFMDIRVAEAEALDVMHTNRDKK